MLCEDRGFSGRHIWSCSLQDIFKSCLHEYREIWYFICFVQWNLHISNLKYCGVYKHKKELIILWYKRTSVCYIKHFILYRMNPYIFQPYNWQKHVGVHYVCKLISKFVHLLYIMFILHLFIIYIRIMHILWII